MFFSLPVNNNKDTCIPINGPNITDKEIYNTISLASF